MSRQRRSGGSPLSLFAFQDIITSVTAIMILMVLIMTLELLAKATRAGVAADDLRNAVELKQSLAVMEETLDFLRAETKDAKQTASMVAKQTAEDLAAEDRSAKREIEELNRELASLRIRQSQSRKKRTESEKNLLQADKRSTGTSLAQQRAAKDLEAARQLEIQNELEEQRQTATRAQLATVSKQTTTLVFNPPQGESLKPLLLEVSASGITVVGSELSDPEAFGWGLIGPPTRFLNWLKTRDKNREYVVIMLRPSGLEKLETVRASVVEQGMELGLELVGDEVDIALARDSQEKP